MLGMLAPHATTYLAVLMTVTTLAFVIPLFVAPLAWARVLRWTIPEHTHLAVYFGRCLGAFTLVVELMMLRAVLTGRGVAPVFDFLIVAFVLMVLVHVYGALRRIQPITETLEIGFWLLLVVLNLVFYPASSFAP